jgi:hypothetical protein
VPSRTRINVHHGSIHTCVEAAALKSFTRAPLCTISEVPVILLSCRLLVNCTWNNRCPPAGGRNTGTECVKSISFTVCTRADQVKLYQPHGHCSGANLLAAAIGKLARLPPMFFYALREAACWYAVQVGDARMLRMERLPGPPRYKVCNSRSLKFCNELNFRSAALNFPC